MKGIFRFRFTRPGVLLALFLFSPSLGAAEGIQEKDGYLYAAPRPLDFVRNLIPDEKEYVHLLFRKESILPVSIVVVSTALLIWKDQYLVDQVHSLGTRWHVSQNPDQSNRYEVNVVGGQSLGIGLPSNIGEGMYFLGDGWFYTGVGTSFLSYGLAAHDNRAEQTASEMAESILTSGFIVQVLKHVTGREDPFKSEVSGGHWRFFPNQTAYAQNVAKFDAFPSGHMAATSASFAVISSNYGEDYWFVKPLGYTLMTILGLQMMNNGVHWAGDYPLAIALGYGFGKIAVKKGRKKKAADQTSSVSISPTALNNGFGMKLRYRF